MKKENPGGFSFFIGAELRIRVKRGKVKRRHKKIFAGAVRNIQTNELRDTGIPQGTFSCPSGNSPCVAPAESSRYV